MSDFREHLEQSLQDVDFKAEWDEQEIERKIMQQIVEIRINEGMSQKELAEKCGMKQANLCRLENGNGNPSVATLLRIAQGLGRKLVIDFV